MSDDRPRILTGFDLNSDSVVSDLRALADTIENGDAYLHSVESTESVAADEDATQSVSVSFIPKESYEGTLRFDYGVDE